MLKLLRLFSVPCHHCNTLVALDERGRSALLVTVFGSLLVAAVAAWATDSSVVLGVMLVLGLYLGFIVVAKVGRLGFSPEDSAGGNS